MSQKYTGGCPTCVASVLIEYVSEEQKSSQAGVNDRQKKVRGTMSWFLKEINDANTVRLCMEDGRLITGRSIGVDTKIVPDGVMTFKSGNKVYHFRDYEIADFIEV